ncbi:MAG TPA: endopeptidase La [Clostridia bacterium]|nr:endopeptidase La [Clostridia bacterium]
MNKRIPLIPLRGLIIFPYMVLYFDVGREKSVAALEQAMLQDQLIFLTTQKDMDVENPLEGDYYHSGTIAKIKQMLKLPGDAVRVLVEGQERARVTNFTPERNFIEVEYEILEDQVADDLESKALERSIKETFKKYSSLSNRIPSELSISLSGVEEPGRFADLIIPQLNITIEEKQALLETLDTKKRLFKLYHHLLQEVEIVELEKDLSEKVKEQMNKSQKEYFLREQMRIIQQELGDEGDIASEAEKLKEKLKKLRLKKDINEKMEKEIDKYSRLNPSSPEAAVSRTYIQWILDLPWNKQSKEQIDLPHAREVLDEDHYGLEKVKERVLEYLAVRKLTGSMKGPIICLVGPPGVGKTSIASSIARSVNRKFIRMSLGGVRDEAEIRGHRRTYIGAIPGRIMTHIKESGVKNPLFLFDEIDKLGSDFRGDPASGLLEVLDPEQNKTFQDHYLEVPFDLSKVMFITTANTTSTIPRALLDRMEVIDITGYTLYEKVQIAERYLIKKQQKENGLEKADIKFSKEGLRTLIEEYTRESGVRELERKIGTICRKIAIEVVESKKEKFSVTKSSLSKYLGEPPYKADELEKEDRVGLVNGLAWTSFGGDTLEIEVNVSPGKGVLSLTGQLGDVMKESAQAGLSYLKSQSEELDIKEDFFSKHDIHVHVPAGAIPKDGPSAGITMATAMASAITNRKASHTLAMTGEITLRGRVMAIGGLKEKLLAAKRRGIKRVVIPKDNERNLKEVPREIKKDLEIIPVSSMEEVLKEALK